MWFCIRMTRKKTESDMPNRSCMTVDCFLHGFIQTLLFQILFLFWKTFTSLVVSFLGPINFVASISLVFRIAQLGQEPGVRGCPSYESFAVVLRLQDLCKTTISVQASSKGTVYVVENVISCIDKPLQNSVDRAVVNNLVFPPSTSLSISFEKIFLQPPTKDDIFLHGAMNSQ